MTLTPVPTHVPALDPEVLELRKTLLTSTEVPSLFGCGFETKLELWHRKRNGLGRDLAPATSGDGMGGAVDPLVRGSVLEPSIARLVAIETGWEMYELHDFWVHPTIDRLGASSEYELVSPTVGALHAELKSVSYFAMLKWSAGAGGEALLRRSYEIQGRVQLMCAPPALSTGQPYVGTVVACLVSGDRLRYFPEPDESGLRWFGRDPMFEAMVEAEVDAFWYSIEKDVPPEPDLDRDMKIIREIQEENLAEGGDPPINLRHDEYFDRLVGEYLVAQEEERKAKKARTKLDTALRARVPSSRIALAQSGKVEFTNRKEQKCSNCGAPVRGKSTSIKVKPYDFDTKPRRRRSL